MKFIAKCKNYFKSILISKTRFRLTILGITVSYFLFFICIFCFDTYKNQIKECYQDFGEDLIVLHKELSNEEIIFINNNYNKSILTYYGSTSFIDISNENYNLHYEITCCTKNFCDNYIISTDFFGKTLDDNPIMEKRDMIVGSSWSDDDVLNSSKVMVINEFGARYFFGDESPMGKKVKIYSSYFKIIGVISDSRTVEDYLENAPITDYDGKKMLPYIEIYMPKSTYNEYIDECEYSTVIIDGNQHSYEDLKSKLKDLNETNYIMYSRQTVDTAIDTAIINFLPIIVSIMGFLGVISIIFLLNTLSFSIKERIPEFGIRLAIGARRKDIMLQIIFEGIIYVTISLIISLYLLLVTYLSLKILFTNINFIVNDVYLSLKSVIILTTVIFFSSIIFILIPSLKVRKMNVIEAIKFE